MRRRALAVVVCSLAGCGGPELLVDLTPPTLIPNGGSAQAGQVEGPTAIPLTGDGAIPEAPPVAEPVPQPPPAEDDPEVAAAQAIAEGEAAARAALGAVEDAPDGSGQPNALADAADTGAIDLAGGAEEEAARAAAPSPVAPVTPQLAPRTRAIEGPGYAFDIPAAWENLDPTGLGSLLIVAANRSMEPTSGFYTNVIVSAEPFPGDAQAYATLNAPALLDAGCLLRDSYPARAGGRPAVDVEAFWINLGGAPYVTLQRYVTDGATGFVVTCAAAEAAFEDERASCLDVLDSFRVD